jgi:diadenosine tetraphosphate (Ap4A) HIT family hydrolase
MISSGLAFVLALSLLLLLWAADAFNPSSKDDTSLMRVFHRGLSNHVVFCVLILYPMFPVHCLRPPRILSSSSSSRLDAAKMVSFHEESRSKLVQGINIVANAVKITLGPKGRNVVLGKSYGPPEIVNDGVTIGKWHILAGYRVESPTDFSVILCCIM